MASKDSKITKAITANMNWLENTFIDVFISSGVVKGRESPQASSRRPAGVFFIFVFSLGVKEAT